MREHGKGAAMDQAGEQRGERGIGQEDEGDGESRSEAPNQDYDVAG